MEKEVYVVLFESVNFGTSVCEDSYINMNVFDNKKSAIDFMNTIIADFKENDELANSDECVEEIDRCSFKDCIMSYCAYKENAYCENHINITIFKKSVFSNSTDGFGI